MRASSLTNLGVGIDYNIASDYDKVLIVAGLAEEIEALAPYASQIGEIVANLPDVLTVQQAVDVLNNLSVVVTTLEPGAEATSELVGTEIRLGVPRGEQGLQGIVGPKGDKGDKGDTGLTGAQGPIGFTGPQGPRGLRGNDGVDGTSVAVTSILNNPNKSLTINFSDGTSHTTDPLKGEDGTSITVTNVVNNPNGTMQINFSDGTSHTTANLTGPRGFKGDTGDHVHHISYQRSKDSLGNEIGPVTPSQRGYTDIYAMWASQEELPEMYIGEFTVYNGLDTLSAEDQYKFDSIEFGATADQEAFEVVYDSSVSGLVATNVQDAIDELVVNTSGIHDAANITTGTLDDARLPDTISSSITGNAATATKLTTARTITLSGDVTGSVSFDGSVNATITTTVAANSVALGTDTTGNYVAGVTQGTGISITGTAGEGWSPTVSLTNVGTAGTYRSVTTDAQGRVTSGTNPTTVAGYGLTDVYTKTEVQTVLPKVGFDTTNVTAPSVGQMVWNIDDATVDIGLNGAVLQIGQEQLVRVRNTTGSTIVNGTAVMATGTLGASGRITVAPANINNSNYKYVLGVATESIAAGADGFCTVFGKVRGIQTNGANYGETWVDGDVIYVKDNDGGALTKVVPTGTQVKLPIAIVINAHATNGTLFVRVTPVDENASYTKTESDGMFVPISADFILDLGGL